MNKKEWNPEIKVNGVPRLNELPDVLMDAFIAGLFEKIKELMSADKSKEEEGE